MHLFSIHEIQFTNVTYGITNHYYECSVKLFEHPLVPKWLLYWGVYYTYYANVHLLLDIGSVIPAIVAIVFAANSSLSATISWEVSGEQAKLY